MIKLPQGKASLLPQGIWAEVGLIAHRGALGFAHLRRIDGLMADGDREILFGQPTLRSECGSNRFRRP